MASWNEKVLRSLGLPTSLIRLIRSDQLVKAIDEAYATYDRANARLDAWEASYPQLAAKAPWSKDREAWKRAGRPRPEWWEVLALLDQPITPEEIKGRLYPNTGAIYKRRKREKLKAAKARQAAQVG